MNLDIQTERLTMQPAWHLMIEDWVALCRRRHPGVRALDLTLRHARDPSAGDEVEAVATIGGRSLKARATAATAGLALTDAFASLERELSTCEEIDERGRIRHATRA